MFHRQQPPSQKKNETTDTEQKTETKSVSNGWVKTANNANTNKTMTNATTKEEGRTTMSQAEAKATSTTETSTKDVEIPRQQNTYAPGRVSQYGTTQYPNYAPSTPTSDKGRQLVIGVGITMSGEIVACEHLVVEGHVEAALKGANVLEVTETGSFNGKVEIEEATIAGTFEGDITVSGRLTVRSTGTISGTITYGELSVEAGATIDGKLNTVKSKSTAKTTNTSAKAESNKAAAKSVPTKEASNVNTTSGNELPFAASAAE
ncbi:MAG: hypothetical protein CMH30_07205 [Micavibrio sp.]|nr:hypothetical protein [Micavibrio sp.]